MRLDAEKLHHRRQTICGRENGVASILEASTDGAASDDSSQSSCNSADQKDIKKAMTDYDQDTILRYTPDRQLSHFIWTSAPQPHAVRRRLILEKYPELENLYGNDPYQAIPAILTVILQMYLSFLISEITLSVWSYILAITIVSGTLNHSLFAAMHEGSHKTIFKSKLASEIFCILTTIPMGVPAAIPFKRYHLDHHIYQGVTHMDPDIPTEAEAWFFRSRLRKLIWVTLLPATYSLRPMITRPKKVVTMDIVNWMLTATVDISICYFWGLRSFLYLLLGTFFSMNFHPFSGHFISEHFIMPDTDMYQETSSYYGWSNVLTYNVGYHNEHHDFPRIPGSSLPLVTKIAREFYAMPHHPSWMKVTWDFILSQPVTPFNRVKRISARGGNLPSDLAKHKYHENFFPFGGDSYFWPKIFSR